MQNQKNIDQSRNDQIDQSKDQSKDQSFININEEDNLQGYEQNDVKDNNNQQNINYSINLDTTLMQEEVGIDIDINQITQEEVSNNKANEIQIVNKVENDASAKNIKLSSQAKRDFFKSNTKLKQTTYEPSGKVNIKAKSVDQEHKLDNEERKSEAWKEKEEPENFSRTNQIDDYLRNSEFDIKSKNLRSESLNNKIESLHKRIDALIDGEKSILINSINSAPYDDKKEQQQDDLSLNDKQSNVESITKEEKDNAITMNKMMVAQIDDNKASEEVEEIIIQKRSPINPIISEQTLLTMLDIMQNVPFITPIIKEAVKTTYLSCYYNNHDNSYANENFKELVLDLNEIIKTVPLINYITPITIGAIMTALGNIQGLNIVKSATITSLHIGSSYLLMPEVRNFIQYYINDNINNNIIDANDNSVNSVADITFMKADHSNDSNYMNDIAIFASNYLLSVFFVASNTYIKNHFTGDNYSLLSISQTKNILVMAAGTTLLIEEQQYIATYQNDTPNILVGLTYVVAPLLMMTFTKASVFTSIIIPTSTLYIAVQSQELLNKLSNMLDTLCAYFSSNGKVDIDDDSHKPVDTDDLYKQANIDDDLHKLVDADDYE